MIDPTDIKKVALDLGITITDEKIQYCMDNYQSEQDADPTGNFSFVIEKMLDDIEERD